MDIKSIFLYNRKLEKGAEKLNKEKDLTSLLISTASIIGIATLISYLFYCGYFSFFNIDYSLIFLNNTRDFIMIAIISVIISIPILSVYCVELIFKSSDSKKMKEIRILKY